MLRNHKTYQTEKTMERALFMYTYSIGVRVPMDHITRITWEMGPNSILDSQGVTCMYTGAFWMLPV